MTLRERFNRIMRFQEVDRLPYVEFRDLFWVQLHRWKNQGMPADCSPFEYFAFDEASNNRATSWLNVGRGLEHIDIDLSSIPRFDPRPPYRKGDYVYYFDTRAGVLKRRLNARKKNDLDVKATVEAPIQTREDWQEYKKRFNPHSPERYPRLKQYHHFLTIYPLDYPETWEEAVADMEKAENIVTICLATGYGFMAAGPVGSEKFLFLVDESEWVHEMVDYFGWFIREALRKAVTTAPIDFASIDDGQPPRTVQGELLISPKMFLDFAGKNIEKNLSLIAEGGIELVQVPFTRHLPYDEKIAQIVVDAGLTPIVSADAEGEFSIASQRKRYGDGIPIMGGMDATVLIEGKEAIDRMLGTVFSEASEGGYFPTLLDRYGVFLEVPLDNYSYYTRSYRKLNGME